jgi:hypothetical protein
MQDSKLLDLFPSDAHFREIIRRKWTLQSYKAVVRAERRSRAVAQDHLMPGALPMWLLATLAGEPIGRLWQKNVANITIQSVSARVDYPPKPE